MAAWYKKERRSQRLLATIAMIVANSNRKKESPAFSVDDFLGWFATEEMET